MQQGLPASRPQAGDIGPRPTLLVSRAAQCTVGQVTPAASAGERAQAGQAACSAGWRLLPCSTGCSASHVAQKTLQIAVLIYATPCDHDHHRGLVAAGHTLPAGVAPDFWPGHMTGCTKAHHDTIA